MGLILNMTNKSKVNNKLLLLSQKASKFDEMMGVTKQFTLKLEKDYARILMNRYFEDYTIETVSELNILSQIIYLEVIQHRLQRRMEEHYREDDKAVPSDLLDMIHSNSESIDKLKRQLGLSSQKTRNAYDVLEHLKRRAQKWREENQGSRSLVCPHCSKMMMLKIRTDVWESQKHPFFKDRILTNARLIDLYRKNKISKKDVADVLETSEDYVDWLIKKWYDTEDKKNIEYSNNNDDVV